MLVPVGHYDALAPWFLPVGKVFSPCIDGCFWGIKSSSVDDARGRWEEQLLLHVTHLDRTLDRMHEYE
jgi:hypothetical protein